MRARPPRSSLAEIEKLGRCQQILGYEFRNPQLLQHALRVGSPEWKRMATAGDTYVQNTLIDRWYSRRELDSKDFSTIRIATLSNTALSNVGLKKGLHHCIHSVIVEGNKVQDADSLEPGWENKSRTLATTVEAVLAAVYRDSMFDDGVRKAIDLSVFEDVVRRLGITHRLIADPADLRWALEPIQVKRKMPPRFFSSGNHLSLAKMLLDVSSTPAGLRVYKPEDPSQGEALAQEARAQEARAQEALAQEARAQEAFLQEIRAQEIAEENYWAEAKGPAVEEEAEPAPARQSWLSRLLKGPSTPAETTQQAAEPTPSPAVQELAWAEETKDLPEEVKEPEPAPARQSWLSRLLKGPSTPAETTQQPPEPTPSPAAPETDWPEAKDLPEEPKEPEPAPARQSWLSRLLNGPSTPADETTTQQQQAAAESLHQSQAAPQPATSGTKTTKLSAKAKKKRNNAAQKLAAKTNRLQTLSDRLEAIQERHEEVEVEKRRRFER